MCTVLNMENVGGIVTYASGEAIREREGAHRNKEKNTLRLYQRKRSRLYKPHVSAQSARGDILTTRFNKPARAGRYFNGQCRWSKRQYRLHGGLISCYIPRQIVYAYLCQEPAFCMHQNILYGLVSNLLGQLLACSEK